MKKEQPENAEDGSLPPADEVLASLRIGDDQPE